MARKEKFQKDKQGRQRSSNKRELVMRYGSRKKRINIDTILQIM